MGRRERWGAVQHVILQGISARCFLEGSRDLQQKYMFLTFVHTMLAGRALWLAGRLLRLAGRARVRARAQRSGLVEAAFPRVAPKSYWFI